MEGKRRRKSAGRCLRLCLSAQQQNIQCANSNFTFSEKEDSYNFKVMFVRFYVISRQNYLSSTFTKSKGITISCEMSLEDQEIVISTKMNPFRRHCTVCADKLLASHISKP